MKRNALMVIITICMSFGFAYGQDKESTELKTIRFSMPPSKPINIEKQINCISVATAAIYEEAIDQEDFKKPKLSVKVGKGTDRLRLWLDGDILTVQVKELKPESYKVTGHNKDGGWLVAMHYGGLVPASYSISLNKNNGFAIWYLNEPMLVLGSVFPYTQCIYLYCTN